MLNAFIYPFNLFYVTVPGMFDYNSGQIAKEATPGGFSGGGQAVTGASSQPIRTIYHPGVPVTVIRENLIFASGRLVVSKYQ